MNKEIEDLKVIINEDHWGLSAVGESQDGFEVIDVVEKSKVRWGSYNDVIVRAPSGRSYSYTYFEGATEDQESILENDTVTEVKAVERQVTVVEWKPIDQQAGRPGQGNPVAPTSDTVCIPCGF